MGGYCRFVARRVGYATDSAPKDHRPASNMPINPRHVQIPLPLYKRLVPGQTAYPPKRAFYVM
jgi:hypothetical protein